MSKQRKIDIYCYKFKGIFKEKYKKRRKDFTIIFRIVGLRVVFFSTFQNADNKAYFTFIIKKIMRNML